MQTVYENFKMIVLFMVITLLFSLAFGDSATEKMVLLVLLSMVILNSTSIINFMKRVSGSEE